MSNAFFPSMAICILAACVLWVWWIGRLDAKVRAQEITRWNALKAGRQAYWRAGVSLDPQGEAIYQCYKDARIAGPDTPFEQWALLFGISRASEMDRRFERELKARGVSENSAAYPPIQEC